MLAHLVQPALRAEGRVVVVVRVAMHRWPSRMRVYERASGRERDQPKPVVVVWSARTRPLKTETEDHLQALLLQDSMILRDYRLAYEALCEFT